MTIKNAKTAESRTRRRANRYELRLMKSRARNPRVASFGMYWLIDRNSNGLVWPYNEFGTDLAEIDEYLDECGGLS